MRISNSLASGLVFLIGCATFSPPPEQPLKPAAATQKCYDTPSRFIRAEKLFVNLDSTKHYYVQGLSLEEGLRQLGKVAAEAETEEAFVYIKDGKRSWWFEVGLKEVIPTRIWDNKLIYRKGQVDTLTTLDRLFSELDNLCAGRKAELTQVHLHPSEREASMPYHFVSSVLSKVIKVKYDERILHAPSPADITQYAALKAAMKKAFATYHSYIVASEGYYTIEVDQEFSALVGQAIQENRELEFRERLEGDWEVTMAITAKNLINRETLPESDSILLTLDWDTALEALRKDEFYRHVTLNYYPFEPRR